MELYKNIRSRRIALKMTQQELAQKLGYKSTSTIAKIESGENDIPQAKLAAFAEALNTTPAALMGINNAAPAQNLPENTVTCKISRGKPQLEKIIMKLESLIYTEKTQNPCNPHYNRADRGSFLLLQERNFGKGYYFN